MKGDVYIGRGYRQRGVNRNCKVANYGRRAAIELFDRHLLSSPQLLEDLWTLSGCRLACHCRAEQDCHDDIITRQFGIRYPSAYDRNDPLSAAPNTNELQYWQNCVRRLMAMMGRQLTRARLREVQDGWDKVPPWWWVPATVFENTVTAKPWRHQVDGQSSFDGTPKISGGREKPE